MASKSSFFRVFYNYVLNYSGQNLYYSLTPAVAMLKAKTTQKRHKVTKFYLQNYTHKSIFEFPLHTYTV